MDHFCDKCSEPIEDGEYIEITVITPYKKLGSRVAFALNAAERVALPETIAHKLCKGRTSGF